MGYPFIDVPTMGTFIMGLPIIGISIMGVIIEDVSIIGVLTIGNYDHYGYIYNEYVQIAHCIHYGCV